MVSDLEEVVVAQPNLDSIEVRAYKNFLNRQKSIVEKPVVPDYLRSGASGVPILFDDRVHVTPEYLAVRKIDPIYAAEAANPLHYDSDGVFRLSLVNDYQNIEKTWCTTPYLNNYKEKHISHKSLEGVFDFNAIGSFPLDGTEFGRGVSGVLAHVLAHLSADGVARKYGFSVYGGGCRDANFNMNLGRVLNSNFNKVLGNILDVLHCSGVMGLFDRQN